MMTRSASGFEFATAGRIVFGAGAARGAADAAAAFGRRICVVLRRDEAGAAWLLDDLGRAGLETLVARAEGEPTVAQAIAGARAAREAGCEAVVAMGGGSALDLGKAIAALMANDGDPLDYLEVIGAGRPLGRPAAPVIALPTTAGTGAEVTRNAVLACPERRVKVSLRHASLLPRVAIIDPELTLTCPPAVTAAAGLDALAQVIEPFVSPAATPLTDGFCRRGMRLAARSLRRAVADGGDRAARADMALAGLLGGLALANAKLGAVHGFAGPLGGLLGAPHGAICARLLGPVTAANLRALRDRAPESPALRRYQRVARILTGDVAARAEDAAEWLGRLAADLEIPPLGRQGLAEAGLAEVVAQARRASSMKGNPIELTDGELAAILREAR